MWMQRFWPIAILCICIWNIECDKKLDLWLCTKQKLFYTLSSRIPCIYIKQGGGCVDTDKWYLLGRNFLLLWTSSCLSCLTFNWHWLFCFLLLKQGGLPGIPNQLDIFRPSCVMGCLDHRFRAHPLPTLPNCRLCINTEPITSICRMANQI